MVQMRSSSRFGCLQSGWPLVCPCVRVLWVRGSRIRSQCRAAAVLNDPRPSQAPQRLEFVSVSLRRFGLGHIVKRGLVLAGGGVAGVPKNPPLGPRPSIAPNACPGVAANGETPEQATRRLCSPRLMPRLRSNHLGCCKGREFAAAHFIGPIRADRRLTADVMPTPAAGLGAPHATMEVVVAGLGVAGLAVVVEVVHRQQRLAAAAAPSDLLWRPVRRLFAKTLALGRQEPDARFGEAVQAAACVHL